MQRHVDDQKMAPGSAALVAAAGAGTRLGQGPKAFLALDGVTLLEFVVRSLAPVVDEILVALPAGQLERARYLTPGARLIEGGATRQESVYRLLRSTDADLVLVHDVARPFLPAAVSRRVLLEAKRSGAASAARPVVDTLIREPDGEPLERERLRAIQTPQAFRRELLVAAHEAAHDQGYEATDDAGLVRAAGGTVVLSEGSPWLLKLTVAEDLLFARRLAPLWRQETQSQRERGDPPDDDPPEEEEGDGRVDSSTEPPRAAEGAGDGD